MVTAMGREMTAYAEELLEKAQAEATLAYDRLDATRELRGLLFDFCGRRGQPRISLAELFELPESAEEDARLRSLIKRAVPDPDPQEEED